MLQRIVLKRGGNTEGESPFWISFSDLMSALMVLFLVVMAVTLVAITNSISAIDKAKVRREKDIAAFMDKVKQDSKRKNVTVDATTFRVDMGELARFNSGQSSITPEAARFLREYIPVILDAYESKEGQDWLRRVVIEGFTDSDGSYLFNVGLSLDRSRSVLCSMFGQAHAGERPLTETQLRSLQNLALVGGYSFNSSIKNDKAASRRVELRLEFWDIDEKDKEKGTKRDAPLSKEFGQC